MEVYLVRAREFHDDIIKWKHFPRYWTFVRGIHRSPVNSPHKGQRRGALMLSLICIWINGWVNNREAGDLRRHRDHYDVIVMFQSTCEKLHIDGLVQERRALAMELRLPCIKPIYIIISKNIRYLLWNRGAWRFFHDTYLTIEVQGIRCTNHLHDSCPYTDVNPHFTAPGCRYFRHR